MALTEGVGKGGGHEQGMGEELAAGGFLDRGTCYSNCVVSAALPAEST